MDWTFFVQRLPDAVQDKILAMADSCLSYKYIGEPILCRYWLFRHDFFPHHGGMVLDDEWWAPGLEDGDDWGELCQMCGRRRDLLPADVSVVQLFMHRWISRIWWEPSAEGRRHPRDFPFGRFVKWEERAVCDECFHMFRCDGVLFIGVADSDSEASDRTW